jgi:hypothetical protein
MRGPNGLLIFSASVTIIISWALSKISLFSGSLNLLTRETGKFSLCIGRLASSMKTFINFLTD